LTIANIVSAAVSREAEVENLDLAVLEEKS
jgi:hypothetical protein